MMCCREWVEIFGEAINMGWGHKHKIGFILNYDDKSTSLRTINFFCKLM